MCAEAGRCCCLLQRALHYLSSAICAVCSTLTLGVSPEHNLMFCVQQRLTGVLVHLVNKLTADMRRALWWQERTAKHRYMLRLAAEKQKEHMQEELAQKRYSLSLPHAV